MGDIVVLDETRLSREEQMGLTWRAYVDARARAERTRDIRDGIAAGKAWARWLELFTGRA